MHPAPEPSPTLPRMTLVLAHRGANRGAPENTVAAFALARDLGADGVELDVHRSADGHLVIHHDGHEPEVGVFARLSLDEIRAQRPDVPTLAEVLDVLEGLLVNIEVKNMPHDPGYDPAHGSVDATLEVLAQRGGRDRVLVSSFNLETIDRVRALDPGIDTGYLTFGVEPAAAVGLAVEHGHGAWHPDRGTVAADPIDIVATAHGAGIAVNVWTVNEPDELVAFAAAGVDAVVTDVPDVALGTLAGRDR